MTYLLENGGELNAQDEAGNTALHLAVINKSPDAVAVLLSLPNVDLKVLHIYLYLGIEYTIQYTFTLFSRKVEDLSAQSPLHIAFRDEQETLANMLIERASVGDLVYAESVEHPLHVACRSKRVLLASIKKLLDKLLVDTEQLTAVLNKLDADKQTVLGVAIDNNQLRVVELLLRDYYPSAAARAADTTVAEWRDPNGQAPVHLAAKSGSVDVLGLVVANGAFSLEPNATGDNALHIAAANNKFNFINAFLAHERKHVEASGSQLTHLASYKAINLAQQTPLYLAVVGGHAKCVEILIELGDIELSARDSNGNTIYHVCAEYNSMEALRLMLKKRDARFLEPLYAKNHAEETVLHMAARHESLEVIKLVLCKIYDGFTSTEAYLTSRDHAGQTFFHVACAKGFYNIVEYFLKDLKMSFLLGQADKQLNTPLHVASHGGYITIVNLLCEFGADVNAKNREGHTALEMSCRKGFFAISKVLINRYKSMQRGADDDASEKDDDDPLHVACHEGAYEVVRLLLAKGADIASLNAHGRNCLDVAIERGHREVCKVLLADPNWTKLIQTSRHIADLDAEQPEKNTVRKMGTFLVLITIIILANLKKTILAKFLSIISVNELELNKKSNSTILISPNSFDSTPFISVNKGYLLKMHAALCNVLKGIN